MIDLHTHTQFSDGLLNPAEHLRQAEVQGYTVVGITDHADASTVEIFVPAIRRFADEHNKHSKTKVICGVELTHVHPATIQALVKRARELGADIVNVHGETVVEPVIPGTNRAAIEAGVDILCHPGLISDEDAKLAVSKGVRLEITSKKGHCYTNGHVYNVAKRCGNTLVYNNDAHSHNDFTSEKLARDIMAGCGIPLNEIDQIFKNSADFADLILKRR